MVRVQGATVIARPVDEVFDSVADERNQPTLSSMLGRAGRRQEGQIWSGLKRCLEAGSLGQRRAG